MARLGVEGDELVLNLWNGETGGFHRDIGVPVSTVCEVRWTNDPWSELRGIRAPGTGIPGVMKDFAAIHGQVPAVVVELEGADYGRLVVTEESAESVTADLKRPLGLA
jgi:hypothetical protein